MKTRSITEVAKSFLNDEIPKDGIICDFTMGGGHDTLYLSDLVPEGKVYAFDIQPLALERTRTRLEEAGGRANVELILDSHEQFDRYVPGDFDAGMFNLGYLPTSDHVVTTKAETTIAAVSKAVERVKVGGTVVVVVYPGHPEGKREGELLLDFAASLSDREFDATYYRLINIPDCPFILAFQKRRSGLEKFT